MDPSEFFYGGGGGGNRPSPRKELQGPRPAVLKVNKDSYKIRKPPVHPPANQPQPPQESDPQLEDRQPVIIYAVSPKVIHTTVTDFMKLVQRLTGNASTAASDGGVGGLSPAARIASIEKASPSAKDGEIAASSGSISADFTDIMGNILESTEFEMGRAPGILSPAPAALQPISPGFFSPATADPFSIMGYSNMFIPSPSTMFPAPLVSPSPSYCDLFNPFFDF